MGTMTKREIQNEFLQTAVAAIEANATYWYSDERPDASRTPAWSQAKIESSETVIQRPR